MILKRIGQPTLIVGMVLLLGFLFGTPKNAWTGGDAKSVFLTAVKKAAKSKVRQAF